MKRRDVPDYKNAVIILNPASGTGDPKERIRKITSLARQFGWHGELVTTTLKRSAASIAASHIKKGKTYMAVCGGDGTIMEVVGMAVNKPVTIGVIPLGTGNLFAQNLHIPLDLEESIHIAFSGKGKKIDVGKANDTFFTIIAGIGFDAEVMHASGRELKNKMGIFAYILSGIRRINSTPGRYRVTIDDKEPVNYTAKSIMVANMGKIQGGIQAVPAANPQSASLKIGIIQARSWYSWVSISLHAFAGNINKSPHYTLHQGKEIEIESLSGPKRYECDGNDFPPTKKLHITLYPQAVTVVTAK